MTGASSPASPGRRVAFVAEELHSSGGLELFELAIAESLARRGWQLELSYRLDGDLLERWQAVATVHRRSAGGASTDDAGAVDAAELAAVVAGADVVYCHWVHLRGHSLDAARAHGIPVVGHLHLPPFHLREGWRALVKGRHRWRMDPRVWSKRSEIDAFAAVSDFTRGQWVRSGVPASRVRTVHNGVDPTVYRPADPDERRAVRAEVGAGDDDVVIGYVGRIDRVKGIHHLVDAHRELAATDARLRLVVIGAPTRDDVEGGERFARELQARSPASVTWLGKRRDVDRWYRGFDALVVPSEWDEPFGLVVVEAMASGVPVLASRRGGIPEILTGPLARWLVEPAADSIRDGLARLLAEDLAALGRAARAHVLDRFTVDHTATGVERMLLDAIDATGPAGPAGPSAPRATGPRA